MGDWVLLDPEHRIHRVLDRKSKFSRKASGSKVQEQLIAANVDSLFIVSSLNQDFNLNRIERYLVLAKEASVDPVVILTKTDLCESEGIAQDLQSQVQRLDPLLLVYSINALDQGNLESLTQLCKPGQTIALLGSSGVGKSTLTNSLLGYETQSTAGIHEDDSKGRHTTTGRSLHIIEPHGDIRGGIILDTPGMRELQLAHVEKGIEETFSDITELAQKCRFTDCTHDFELAQNSGCAVQQAILNGTLEKRRLLNYLKLQREEAHNSATLAEQRDKDKQFGKMVRNVMKEKKKSRGR